MPSSQPPLQDHQAVRKEPGKPIENWKGETNGGSGKMRNRGGTKEKEEKIEGTQTSTIGGRKKEGRRRETRGTRKTIPLLP